MAKSIHKAQSRHEAFARQYVILKCDGTAAGIAAGFSRKTAAFQASRLLKNVKVKALITRLLAEQNKKHDISVERTLAELARCAFVDPAALFNSDGSLKRIAEMDADTRACIAGVEMGGKGRKQVERIKMTDKLRALDMLGRYLKLFAEDRNPVDLGVKVIILDAPRPVRIGFSNAGALPPANGNGKPHDED